jgi:hypothetical protein
MRSKQNGDLDVSKAKADMPSPKALGRKLVVEKTVGKPAPMKKVI